MTNRMRLDIGQRRIVLDVNAGDRLVSPLVASHGANLCGDYRAEHAYGATGSVSRLFDSSGRGALARSVTGPTARFPDRPAGDSRPSLAPGAGLSGRDCVRFGVGQSLIAAPVDSAGYPVGTVVCLHMLAKFTSAASAFQSFASVYTLAGLAASFRGSISGQQYYSLDEGILAAAGAYDSDWHVWSHVATDGGAVRLLRDGVQIGTSGGTSARGLSAAEQVLEVAIGDPISFYPGGPSVPNQAAFDLQHLTLTGVETQEQVAARAAMYLDLYDHEIVV